jgi:hypothetical protein
MITIGSRVRYIHEDTEDDKKTGYYPPIGTLGTVKMVEEHTFEVQWDSGVKGCGPWWCHHTDVVEIYNPTTNGNVVAIRIYLKDGRIPMADLAFTNGDMLTIEWANVKEHEFYAPRINAYTLIYDTRPKASFTEWIKEA